MKTDTSLAALIWIVIVVAVVIYNVVKIKKKRADDAMLAALSPDERAKILEHRALMAAERARVLAEENEMRDQVMKNLQTIQEEHREATKQLFAGQQSGPINPSMVCPHCQTKGRIRTKKITKKTGVSGGKAAAAVVTGGLSVLAVGLSRKEDSTQAHCDNCNNTWFF